MSTPTLFVRILFAIGILSLQGGCAAVLAETPTATSTAGPIKVVLVSQEHQKTTPTARCGAGCWEKATVTPDVFFERFGASLIARATGQAEANAVSLELTRTPMAEAASRSLIERTTTPSANTSTTATVTPSPSPSLTSTMTVTTTPTVTARVATTPAVPRTPLTAAQSIGTARANILGGLSPLLDAPNGTATNNATPVPIVATRTMTAVATAMISQPIGASPTLNPATHQASTATPPLPSPTPTITTPLRPHLPSIPTR